MLIKVAKARIDASAYMVDRAKSKLAKAQDVVVEAEEGFTDTLVKISHEADCLQLRVNDLNDLVTKSRGL